MCFKSRKRVVDAAKKDKLAQQQNERAGYKVALSTKEQAEKKELQEIKRAKRKSLMDSMTEGQKKFGPGFDK